MQRFVDTEMGKVRLPPQRTAMLARCRTGWIVDMVDTRRRMCSTHQYRRDCDCGTVNEYYTGGPPTLDPRLAVLVTFVEDQIHEGLEWVTLDGEPFAPAHPKIDRESEATSDWLAGKLIALFEEYREKFQ